MVSLASGRRAVTLKRMIRLMAIVVGVLVPMSAALAQDYPKVNCALSEDASRVVVTASNPGSTAYTCVASCRANVTGQRAFDNVDCSFGLGAGAAAKAVCTRKGGGANFFSAIGPTRFACAPRN